MYATCRRDRHGMVGGRSRKTRQYCRPWEPAIANQLPCHEMHHQVSRRRVAPGAQNRVPGGLKVRKGQFCRCRDSRLQGRRNVN